MIFFFGLLCRAAQRMSNNNAATKSRVPEMPSSERGGFCGALQRAPPPMPAGLARRLANKDNFGLGKVSHIYFIYLIWVLYLYISELTAEAIDFHKISNSFKSPTTHTNPITYLFDMVLQMRQLIDFILYCSVYRIVKYARVKL